MFFRKETTKADCKGCGHKIELGWIVCPWCTQDVTSGKEDPAKADQFSTQQSPTTISARRQLVMEKLSRELDAARAMQKPAQELSDAVTARMSEIIKELFPTANESEQDALVENVKDEMFGFGPIGPLVRDPSVVEIQVESPKSVLAMRNGKMEKTSVAFDSEQHVHRLIDKIFWGDKPSPIQLIIRKTP